MKENSFDQSKQFKGLIAAREKSKMLAKQILRHACNLNILKLKSTYCLVIIITQNKLELKEMSENLERFKINNKMYVSAATFLLTAAVAYWTISSIKAKQRQQKKKQQVLAQQSIHKQTIIIAFQPQNLFIKLRNDYHFHCKSIKKTSGGVLNRICSLFTKKLGFYEQKVSAKNLRKMIKELKKYQNVKLKIYTRLQKQFIKQILEDFGILSEFEQQNIIIMQSEYKSAQEIDHETKRVVIISANKEDRNESILGSNHKIILDLEQDQKLETGTLNKLQLFLMKLAARGDIDNLHQLMHQWAIDMNLPLLNDQS